MPKVKSFTVSVPEVSVLVTSYIKMSHQISLEVDDERILRLLETLDEKSGETGEKPGLVVDHERNLKEVFGTRGGSIKVLEVDVATKKVVFELPAGYPVFLPNPSRRSFYADTPIGRPAVAQVYLSFADKTRVALDKKLKRELVVTQQIVDLLEVGKLAKQVELMELLEEKAVKEAADHEADHEEEVPEKSTTSKKVSSQEKRKAARLAEHASKSCTCNKYGHKCHAVEKYGKKARKFS